MVQMKPMIHNLISELILFLPACTINEKYIQNHTFTHQRYLHIYWYYWSVLSNISGSVVKYQTFCLDAGIIIFHIVILGSNVQFQTSIHLLLQTE